MELVAQITQLVNQFQSKVEPVEVESAVRELVEQYPMDELLQAYAQMVTDKGSTGGFGRITIVSSSDKFQKALREGTIEYVQNRYQRLEDLTKYLLDTEEVNLQVKSKAFTYLMQIGLLKKEVRA